MLHRIVISALVLLFVTTGLLAFPEAQAFHRPDFRGERFIINGDWTAHHRHAPWNDAINALRIPRGYEAILYEHTHFQGDRLVVRGDWSALEFPRWRNRISSIQLIPLNRYPHDCNAHCAPNCRGGSGRDYPNRRPRYDHPGRGNGHAYGRQPEVLMFQDTDYRGPLLRLTSDWSANYSDNYWNDNISSIRVPRGYALIAYEHAGFQGRYLTIRGNWSASGYRDFWNDRISSVRLVRE